MLSVFDVCKKFVKTKNFSRIWNIRQIVKEKMNLFYMEHEEMLFNVLIRYDYVSFI